MTYCVGLLLKDGLVMLADTRTNAGLDNIAIYRKLHIFERPGERVVFLATAGNLAISQAVLSTLTDGLPDAKTGDVATIWTPTSLFETAKLVGRAVRAVHALDAEHLEQANASFDVSLLVGGQIAGGRLRLFMVYAAGNFIEASADTPFLQIGEHKYGKPILDRAVTADTSLQDALKLGLISMDSTMRSNLGVGMPVDIAVLPRDACRIETAARIDRDEPYFRALRAHWSGALRQAHEAIAPPPYAGRDHDVSDMAPPSEE